MERENQSPLARPMKGSSRDLSLAPKAGQPPDDGRKEGRELPVNLQEAPPLTANPLIATNKGSGFSFDKPNPSSGRPRSTAHYQEARLAKLNELARGKQAIYSRGGAEHPSGGEGAGTSDPTLRRSPAPCHLHPRPARRDGTNKLS